MMYRKRVVSLPRKKERERDDRTLGLVSDPR